LFRIALSDLQAADSADSDGVKFQDGVEGERVLVDVDL